MKIKMPYIAQAFGIFKELITEIKVANLLRKLMLYPAELRGPLNPVIFYLSLAGQAFLPIYHAISSHFTRFHEERLGKTTAKRRQTFSVLSRQNSSFEFKKITQPDASGGKQWGRRKPSNGLSIMAL